MMHGAKKGGVSLCPHAAATDPNSLGIVSRRHKGYPSTKERTVCEVEITFTFFLRLYVFT